VFAEPASILQSPGSHGSPLPTAHQDPSGRPDQSPPNMIHGDSLSNSLKIATSVSVGACSANAASTMAETPGTLPTEMDRLLGRRQVPGGRDAHPFAAGLFSPEKVCPARFLLHYAGARCPWLQRIRLR